MMRTMTMECRLLKRNEKDPFQSPDKEEDADEATL